MSPARARTSRAAIVAAARELLERGGLEAVTMATVASLVGVRPASLYKHVRDREALLVAVGEDAARALSASLTAAASDPGGDPGRRLSALADAYRSFATQCPRAASMLFADLGPGTGLPVEASAAAARPVIDVATAMVGPGDALPAARVLTAFVYGFTSMEAAGAFRLGGDVDRAFRLGVDVLARGLAGSTTPQP
jgi:AcrR family transcriptional regulator